MNRKKCGLGWSVWNRQGGESREWIASICYRPRQRLTELRMLESNRLNVTSIGWGQRWLLARPPMHPMRSALGQSAPALLWPFSHWAPFPWLYTFTRYWWANMQDGKPRCSVHRRGISYPVISKFTFCVTSVLGKLGQNKWAPLSPRESWMLDTTKFNVTQRGSVQRSTLPVHLQRQESSFTFLCKVRNKPGFLVSSSSNQKETEQN